MKEETTKMKDRVSFALKTPFVLEEIPHLSIPGKFQIKIYRPNKLAFIVLDQEFLDELKALCEQRGLKVEEVVYGSLVKLKKMLEPEKEETKGE